MKLEEQKLRVLHVLPSLGIGGAEIMAMHLMAGLSSTHDVGAVGLYPERGSHVEAKLRQSGVELFHLGKRPGMDLRMLPALKKVLKTFRPDIVHTHLSVLRYVYPVLLRHPVPIALHTLHNTAEREADAFGKFVQRFAFRKTVVPVAISQDGSATFSRVYGWECSAVVPNCIPVREYQAKPEVGQKWRSTNHIPENAVVFTCVGRLEDQKNPLGLLSAFSAVRNEDARLVFLGNGSLRSQLESAIRTMALRGRVLVLGESENVRDCLAGSDVFVLGSRWEGSPLAVMEAMAAGLPVISTAVGGVPELVESGREGILVPPRDTPALGRAIQELADDPFRRRRMGCAARNRAESEFDVDTMTRKYAALYRWLLSSGRGAAHGPWNPARAYAASVQENDAP